MGRLLAPGRPDWRWARAVELAQYSPAAAAARLEKEDELTKRAYEFRRAMDHGTEYRHPVMDAAYQLFLNEPSLKMLVDGMLIAGCDDHQIADQAMTDEQVIACYHDTFFWVRPGLDKSAWLNSVVFGGMLEVNANSRDVYGVVLRLARKLGGTAFIDLISAGIANASTLQQLMSITRQVLTTQAAMISFTVGGGRDLPEWVVSVASDKANTTGAVDDASKAVDEFLAGITLSVADPTEVRKITPPAREERVLTYEVVNDA